MLVALELRASRSTDTTLAARSAAITAAERVIEVRTCGIRLYFRLTKTMRPCFARRDQSEFYSWLGGVLPEYRGLGVAVKLMTTQHEWCQRQGYLRIGTKTQNRFKEMLMLNIKNGFEIIGTDPTDKDGMKILMEKKINGN